MNNAGVVADADVGAHVLVGRDREIRLVDGLLAAAARRCCALVLRGEPGIGRSALLRHAERAATARVLWLSGVEAEADLPFATLADLVLPLRDHLVDLPDAQRTALEICLALGEGSLASPYAACAGTLNLLAAAGERQPLVLLVDDLQWIDEPSRQVLLFVARRLAVERVAMVLTVRSEAAWICEGSELPTVDVVGLPPEACGALLAARGISVAPSVLADLVPRVGGNPSALLEAVGSLRSSQLGGSEPVDDLPPPGRRLRRAWSERIDELPEATRAALVVLAAGSEVPVDTLARALAAVRGSLADLDAAHQAGLVSVAEPGPGAPGEAPLVSRDARGGPRSARRVCLAHPLLRAVVLDGASPAARLRAYEALAEACEGEAAVWYAAAAVSGPDDGVAAALADAATASRARAGYGASARAWHRAAELTGDRDLRGERFLRAAGDAQLAGLAREASAWADQAARLVSDPVRRSDVEFLRGRILTWSGHLTRARERLLAAAESVRALDADRAAALLTESVLPALMDGRADLALGLSRPGPDAGPDQGLRPVAGLIQRGRALVLSGQTDEAAACLHAVGDQLAAADPVLDQQVLALAGHTLLDLEQDANAIRLLTEVVDTARRAEAPAMLPYALATRGELESWRGLWAAGYADGVDALRWAEDLGQPPALGHSLAMLARIDAARGDRALCEQRVARLRAEVGPYGIGMLDLHADSVLGLAAVTYGEYDVAALALADAWERAGRLGVGHPNAIPFTGDLAEAHIRTGELDQAERVVAWLEERARATGLAWPAAVAARCRGLMADGLPAAEAAFAAAERAHDRRQMPFERARTRLCHGEMLRRLRRPAAARPVLREARVAFESLGAHPWVRRANAELAAAGDRAERSATGPARTARLDRLTPAELQVARAICDGMNNAEAAAALFVSRKTVESHLTRVYRKLGIRSRSELVRVLVAAGMADPLPGG